MLFLTGTLIFVPAVAYVSWRLSNDALTDSVDGRLQAIARVLVTGIERAGAGWLNSTASLAESRQTREALAEFRSAYGNLSKEVTLDDAAWARIGGDLREAYGRRLWQPLARTRGGQLPEREGWLPGREGMLVQTIEFGGGSRIEDLLGTSDRLRRSFARSSYARAVDRHEPVWQAYAARADLADLLLVDANGTVLYGLAKTPLIGQSLTSALHQSSVPARMFRAAMLLGEAAKTQAFISDVVPSEWHQDDPSLWLAAPVADDSGRRAGVILARVSTTRSLDPLVSFNQREAEVGLGETGAAILVGRNGVFRANYRFASRLPAGSVRPLASSEDGVAVTTAGVARLPASSPAMKKLFLSDVEREGVMDDTDDTGVVTRLACRAVRVSDLPWGVIVQLTRSEGIAAADRLRNYLGAGAAVLCLIGGLVLYLAVSSMLAPLRDLATAAEKMRHGDLTARADVRKLDEVGIAATAANQMVDALVTAKRKSEDAYTELRGQVQHLTGIFNALGAGDLTQRAQPMSGPVGDLAEAVNSALGLLSGFLSRAVHLAHAVANRAEVVMGQQHAVTSSAAGAHAAAMAAHDESASSKMSMGKVTVAASATAAHAQELRARTEEGMVLSNQVQEGMRSIAVNARHASRRLQQSAEDAMLFERHIEEITNHAKTVSSHATNVGLALRNEQSPETRSLLGEIRTLADKSKELAQACVEDFRKLMDEIGSNLRAAEAHTSEMDGHAAAVESAREAQERTLLAGTQSHEMLDQLNGLVLEVDSRLDRAAAESRQAAVEAENCSGNAQETLRSVQDLSTEADLLVSDTKRLRLAPTALS